MRRPGPTPTGVGFGYGVQGSSVTAAGLVGWSVDPPEVAGRIPARLHRVYRRLRFGAGGRWRDAFGSGVWGDSPDVGVYGTGGTGVYGYGDNGVVGESASTAAGVLAIASAATNIGLEVQGKVKFSRSGRATLGAGKSSIKVTLAGTTTGSRVFAVLHTNRTGRWVQSVVPTTGSFTIYLNGTVAGATYIAWWVIN